MAFWPFPLFFGYLLCYPIRGGKIAQLVRHFICLHMTQVWSQAPNMIPWALPGVIPDNRARSKSLSVTEYGPQTQKLLSSTACVPDRTCLKRWMPCYRLCSWKIFAYLSLRVETLNSPANKVKMSPATYLNPWKWSCFCWRYFSVTLGTFLSCIKERLKHSQSWPSTMERWLFVEKDPRFPVFCVVFQKTSAGQSCPAY